MNILSRKCGLTSQTSRWTPDLYRRGHWTGIASNKTSSPLVQTNLFLPIQWMHLTLRSLLCNKRDAESQLDCSNAPTSVHKPSWQLPRKCTGLAGSSWNFQFIPVTITHKSACESGFRGEPNDEHQNTFSCATGKHHDVRGFLILGTT